MDKGNDSRPFLGPKTRLLALVHRGQISFSQKLATLFTNLDRSTSIYITGKMSGYPNIYKDL